MSPTVIDEIPIGWAVTWVSLLREQHHLRAAEQRHRPAGRAVVDACVPYLGRAPDVAGRGVTLDPFAGARGAQEVGLQLDGRERSVARRVERYAHRAAEIGDTD